MNDTPRNEAHLLFLVGTLTVVNGCGAEPHASPGEELRTAEQALATPSVSNYSTSVTCDLTGLDGNSSVDAAPAIQNCIDTFVASSAFKSAGGGTAYLPAKDYYLSSPILVGNVSGLGIRSAGYSSSQDSARPACGEKGALACTHLIASSDFDVPASDDPVPYNGAFFNADNVTNFDLDHLDFDGNRWQRLSGRLYDNCQQRSTQQQIGYNVTITLSHHVNILGIVSENTLCGSSFNYNNTIYGVFLNDIFRNNGQSNYADGTPVPPGTVISDGITGSTADGMVVTDCTFLNNSDVSLIVGDQRDTANAPATVTFNTFQQVDSYNPVTQAYFPQMVNAALLVNNWGTSVSDLNGAVIAFNAISGGGSTAAPGARFCTVGIASGGGLWNNDIADVSNFTIAYNTVDACWEGIVVWNAQEVRIYGNEVTNWVPSFSAPAPVNTRYFSATDTEGNSTITLPNPANSETPTSGRLAGLVIEDIQQWFSTPGLTYTPPTKVLPACTFADSDPAGAANSGCFVAETTVLAANPGIFLEGDSQVVSCSHCTGGNAIVTSPKSGSTYAGSGAVTFPAFVIPEIMSPGGGSITGWSIPIVYVNPDTVPWHALLQIDGVEMVTLAFPATGDAEGSISVSLAPSVLPIGPHWLAIVNDAANGPMPKIVSLTVQPNN